MFNSSRKMTAHSASFLLLLLLSADFVFIVLHIIIGIFDPNPSLCDISGICAYMSVYHLIKLFALIILFTNILRLTRFYGYASWIFMFTFFLFDDALLLHQKVGDHLAGVFDAYLFHDTGLQSRYFELAVLATAGIILLAMIAWSFYHGNTTFRKISMDLLLFITALVFFGLMVDIAEWLKLGQTIIFGLGFIEDGGELAVYSLIVWYVFFWRYAMQSRTSIYMISFSDIRDNPQPKAEAF